MLHRTYHEVRSQQVHTLLRYEILHSVVNFRLRLLIRMSRAWSDGIFALPVNTAIEPLIAVSDPLTIPYRYSVECWCCMESSTTCQSSLTNVPGKTGV
jgi:hypothetical protein